MSKRSEMEALGEQIAEHAAHLDAATHRLLTHLRQFDENDGWAYQSASSCAHWLSWRTGMNLATAREHVRVARKLGELPLVDDALERGVLSYSKARAITRVASPATEATLLGYAEHMCGEQLVLACRKLGAVQRHDKVGPKDENLRRYVSRRDLDDGMVKIEAVLHPDEAAMFWGLLDRTAADATRTASEIAATASSESGPATSTVDAEVDMTDDSVDAPAGASAVHDSDQLDCSMPLNDSVVMTTFDTTGTVASAALGSTEASSTESERFTGIVLIDTTSGSHHGDATNDCEPRRMRPTRFDRADALMSIVQAAVRGERPDRAPVELVVTISQAALRRDPDTDPMDQAAVLSDGTCITVAAARRLACDAGVIELREDADGNVLSVGRKTRTLNTALKRALKRRDPHCQFPGCTNHLFLEAHHVQHWADGGETSLDNAVQLCSFHHRCMHEHDFTVELGSSRVPHRFFDRDMRPIEIVPHVAPRSDRGWPAIYAANQHLQITPETAACRWDGAPIDYGLVIESLCRLEDSSRKES